MTEQVQKLKTIRTWMAAHDVGALYLQTASSFAWATCGVSCYINTASTNGQAALLITPDHQFLITTNIEAPRLETEQHLAAQGWEPVISPWQETRDAVADLCRGLSLASDGHYLKANDLSAELARLRAKLTPEEGRRFRILGKLCAQAMKAACEAVEPGQTEYEIAARLAFEAERLGAQATVNLIATDERIFAYRHPLPTAKKLEQYAMLVLCGRKDGLVCSLTRLVHFGRLTDEINIKQAACAQVDGQLIKSTCPGRTLGDIFAGAVAAYAKNGFPDEWKKHHQGGAAGYEPREYLAVPGSTDTVSNGQVYAWNPSITGCKSEDTILVGENGNEILTGMADWPATSVDGISRPLILVR